MIKQFVNIIEQAIVTNIKGISYNIISSNVVRGELRIVLGQ